MLTACTALAACGPGDTPDSPDGRADGSSPPDGTSPDNNAAATPSLTGSDAFEALPAPYNTADYSLGRRTFKLCGSCHTVREGGQNLVGPNLHGIIGREVGTLDSFGYSSVLEEADFTWTPEKLEEWLSNPRGFLPGNNMTFAGVHRPADRKAVIAYLMLESGYEAEAAGAVEDGGDETRPVSSGDRRQP